MSRETVLVFVVLVAVVALTNATEVNYCNNGPPYEDNDQVKISNCDKGTCKLKRGTRTTIEERFVPDRDIQTLITSVSANVLGLSLPFIGVDGTDACGNVYNTDGSNAGCPLTAGTEYIYRNEFPILQIYPKITTVVHYALRDSKDVVTCFEVPSKITD